MVDSLDCVKLTIFWKIKIVKNCPQHLIDKTVNKKLNWEDKYMNDSDITTVRCDSQTVTVKLTWTWTMRRLQLTKQIKSGWKSEPWDAKSIPRDTRWWQITPQHLSDKPRIMWLKWERRLYNNMTWKVELNRQIRRRV